ncbi:DUF3108 domain-containing protein [Flavobacteriaceae bacterium S356]|uniref:DUF3108 domain-containing protein n=1 Tax=Asprobacillus argus TaxID=3076534 RepID=A0ABU3LDC1_9FLAO|nr:DUF3108 domain-containing protein [Flavobacteriaceae bacterium S356]
MKRNLILLLLVITTLAANGQEKTTQKAFKSGEWLRYKMSYSGFLRAGTAILEVKEEDFEGKKVFHAKGTGWTSGMISWFFKVKDVYESYFDTEKVKPYLFKRDVNEGGYTIKRDTKFDYDTKKAKVVDHKRDTTKYFTIADVQDMISSFYYLRNQKVDTLKTGDSIKIDMFFDGETFPFQLKYLGRKKLRTKFGKIETYVFKPLVQAGRVFKENESVTIWVTADKNKIPIKLKASLAVGSLRADLEGYKGLANSFKIIVD